MSQGAGQPPMARIVAFHKRPTDPEAFLKYYRDVHIPIVRKIPGVRNIRWGKVLRTADGSPDPCWLISDVYFDNLGALETALRSPEMQESFADVSNFIRAGDVQIMFCEAQDTSPLQEDQPT
ncbi:MAG TPA: EthD family reductase [Candidatus Dormibacteraeota bacterium]|nr:EthD family reductase [Candidatus Dormibacteraeota bacterium]